MKKSVKVLLIILAVIVGLGAAGFGVFAYLKSSGKAQLEAVNDTSKIKMESETVRKDEEPLKENQVQYNGIRYQLKEDVYNILVMGIDTTGEVVANQKTGKGGQADTLFLISLDNKNKKATMINIDRDTMTDISIYNYYGKFSHKQKEQIALSYAYGDSKEKSAKLTCEAVSGLLHGMPIHAYSSINTSAISIINDTIGGVKVSLLDDFTQLDSSYTKGKEVLLTGGLAERYIRARIGTGDGTNVGRMARQKQYMQAFISGFKSATKSDVTVPVKLYQSLKPYMVTDITVNQVTYLATQVLEYSFSQDMMLNIQGSADDTGTYNEFNVDEKALYEMILDVFYEKL